MEHTINEVQEGTGNMSTITPVCSCGWKGHGVASYNDDQFFQVNQQKKFHLCEVENAARANPTAF